MSCSRHRALLRGRARAALAPISPPVQADGARGMRRRCCHAPGVRGTAGGAGRVPAGAALPTTFAADVAADSSAERRLRAAAGVAAPPAESSGCGSRRDDEVAAPAHHGDFTRLPATRSVTDRDGHWSAVVAWFIGGPFQWGLEPRCAAIRGHSVLRADAGAEPLVSLGMIPPAGAVTEELRPRIGIGRIHGAERVQNHDQNLSHLVFLVLATRRRRISATTSERPPSISPPDALSVSQCGVSS